MGVKGLFWGCLGCMGGWQGLSVLRARSSIGESRGIGSYGVYGCRCHFGGIRGCWGCQGCIGAGRDSMYQGARRGVGGIKGYWGS